MERGRNLRRLSGLRSVLAVSWTTLLMQTAVVSAQEGPVATVAFSAAGRSMASVSVFPGVLDPVLTPRIETTVLDYLRNHGYDFRALEVNFVGTSYAECESPSNDVWGNLFSSDDPTLLTAFGLDFANQVVFSIYEHNCTRTGGGGILLVARIGSTSPDLAYLSWTFPHHSAAAVEPFGESGSAAVVLTHVVTDAADVSQSESMPVLWHSLASTEDVICGGCP